MANKSRREQLEEMLAEDPNDTELCYMLGMELASAGDDEGAVRCFEDLLKVDPTYPPGYHQAGRALLRLGKMDQAMAMLRRGVEAAEKRGDLHAAGEMQALLESLQ
jgi:tetratricopeptide (TPR) repeat protein